MTWKDPTVSNRQNDTKRIPPSEYRNYLRSQEWRNLRQSYLNSGMSCNCFCCHAPWNNSFVFHHCTYQRLGNERLSDIRPVCRTCHGDIHKSPIGRNGSIWSATLALAQKLQAGVVIIERPTVQTPTLNKQEILRVMKETKAKRKAAMRAKKKAKASVPRGDKSKREYHAEIRKVAKAIIDGQ